VPLQGFGFWVLGIAKNVEIIILKKLRHKDAAFE